MSRAVSAPVEVFTVREVARAAGVPVRSVRELVTSGAAATLDGTFLRTADAVACVKWLRGEAVQPDRNAMFSARGAGDRSPAAGILGSTALHGAMLAGILIMTTWGVTTAREEPPARLEPARLVFLVKPGPGGGGGGGGLKQPKPPAKAEMKSRTTLKSPVPPPKPPVPRKPDPERITPPPPPVVQAAPKPVDPPPPPPRPEVTPQVIAPVVTASSDARDRAGVPAETPARESQGSGSGGGAGTGQGTGLGEGTGPGIGPGSGGGTGGGPYRPGSGITPPQLIREVKPDYTDDARRRNIEGDVVLEIVVRRDGSVGDLKVLQGLGGGLDRRAVDAVRQWKFAPAKRFGTPVDVIVEVAVEFKLR